MSSSLGIAAVTAVLRDVIVNRVAGEPLASAVGSVTVSSMPPDRIDLSGANDPNQINLFLHQVTRNPGWANEELPSRNSAGERIANPPLVLDLRYLVSVYGSDAFRTEMLLGEVMHEFHERPVLSRAVITRALNPISAPPDLPAVLAGSGLETQLERIRLAPDTLNAEEISKLWSALQARYRLTVAYQVTTVILDSTAPGKASLPVRRSVGSAVSLDRPEIAAVVAKAGAHEPITAGSQVRLLGRRLVAPDMRVMLGDTELTSALVSKHESELILALPSTLPFGIQAGPQGLQVIHPKPLGDPPSLRDAVESNLAPFVLRPLVTASMSVSGSKVEQGVTYHSGTLTLQVNPPVSRLQKVVALLNESGSTGKRAYRFRAPEGNGVPPGDTHTSAVEVPCQDVAAGTYLVRVQVDGADSPLTLGGSGLFESPHVEI